MDFSAIVFVIFVAIIVLALLGIVTQRISDKYSISREQSRAKAYATRNDSNTFVLRELAKHGPHEVTLDENAVMTVTPAKPAQQAATVAQGPSIGVRYVIDDAHPDSIQRRDLLRIVEHTIRYNGNDGTTIRAGNKCHNEKVINPVEWTAAVKFGVERFGVIAKPKDVTEVGHYQTLADLADAINKYELAPTAPA
ncbi:MAG: hypothetical protein IPO08_22490 [Xanthomonadales bacterium]|nr:hypothetical protein [Xanthomonadales bacterium]